MDQRAEILIVDDMPDQIAFASGILREEGYRTYAAINGQQALKLLERKHPDLIVLDIKMQGMDGLEVCRKIKEHAEWKDIPVIFLTTENRSEIIRQGFEAGCCDYVVKPYVREEYLARVRTHLQISRQTRDLAAANRELDLFCSAVSHDLQSPLQVIQLLVNTLCEDIDKDKEKQEILKVADLIKGKSEQLEQMIKRLLEFSRMCNITPNIKELSLNQILEDVMKELKQFYREQNITVISGTLGSVQGDEVLIRLALQNVLSNAIKFSSKRSSTIITVSIHEQETYKVLEMADNGVGFDMEYANQLFQIFERLHSQEEYPGSGVGLALVDRIMKRHGGKVSIVGEVDRGAKVSLYFPL